MRMLLCVCVCSLMFTHVSHVCTGLSPVSNFPCPRKCHEISCNKCIFTINHFVIRDLTIRRMLMIRLHAVFIICIILLFKNNINKLDVTFRYYLKDDNIRDATLMCM